METFVLRGLEYEPSYGLAERIQKRFKVNIKDIKLDFPEQDILGTHYDVNMNLELDGVGEDQFLILNGTGHFHHRTYFILKALGKRCSYLHVDAHSDISTTGTKNRYMGCSDFVLYLAELEHIEHLYLVGVRQSPKFKNDKITMFGPSRYANFGLEEFSMSRIESDRIYLSIDLDVAGDILTDFENDGAMSFKQLCGLCEKVVDDGRIIGADICGLAYFRRKNHKSEYESSLERLVDLYKVFRKV